MSFKYIENVISSDTLKQDSMGEVYVELEVGDKERNITLSEYDLQTMLEAIRQGGKYTKL